MLKLFYLAMLDNFKFIKFKFISTIKQVVSKFKCLSKRILIHLSVKQINRKNH
ncbi:unnamed protein product [Brugia timori]|uniref:Uncharacterized protein n=1 Tax=Brugia timori TaxID=42155 RepID=A0A0R3R2G1_9BILA|nr:unnamed protein product [Brugia timori]